MSVPGAREHSLQRLHTAVFDVLVIGAGIVGARIALEATRAGLRVALVDAGDFGGATSCASGKLVHGGLRYLRTGNLRLVRAARRELRLLAGHVAPHLVHRLPFLLATDGPCASPGVAAGLFAYWALDGFRKPAPSFVSAKTARGLIPPLRAAGTHALLEEAVTDDGRLTLATVKAAARAGAVAANYLRVIDLQCSGNRVFGAVLERCDGEGSFALRCRAVVNATGPWIDEVRLLEDPGRRPLARLSKGVHLTLPLADDWRAAVAYHRQGTPHVYAVPWHGMLLLGTTDTAYEGDPRAVSPTPDDASYLLDAAASFLPPELLLPEKVRFSFAGLRVLPPGSGETCRASREHIISVGPTGMVSVSGGKLTTHRLIALDALRALPNELRPRRLASTPEPLPGGSPPDLRALRSQLDAPTAEYLIQLHGSEAGELLDYAARYPDALERIHPQGPDLWAQAYRAADEEWALTAEDIVRRRTTLSIRGLDTADTRARISTVLHRVRS